MIIFWQNHSNIHPDGDGNGSNNNPCINQQRLRMGDKIYGKFRRRGLVLAAVGVLAAVLIWSLPAWSGHGRSDAMPEFTTASEQLWVNSKPLKKSDLKGRVLLLEIWTSI